MKLFTSVVVWVNPPTNKLLEPANNPISLNTSSFAVDTPLVLAAVPTKVDVSNNDCVMEVDVVIAVGGSL